MLFTPESLIKKMLMEAETFTLSPEDDGNPVPDSNTSVSDVAMNIPVAGQQSPVSIPPVTMPLPDASAPTSITKTVINADLILSHLSELKSIINNYEKRFSGDDVGIEEARVGISSFLNALAYHAEKLKQFLNIGEVKPGEVTDAPAPAPTDMPLEDAATDLPLGEPDFGADEDTSEPAMSEPTDVDLKKPSGEAADQFGF